MADIDYYFSVLSPWAYFASDRLEQVASRHGKTIGYRPIDAMTVFKASGGQPVHERPPARQAYRLQELRRTSARTGMAYHQEPAYWPADARPASIAIIATEMAGTDPAPLIRAALSAVWSEQRNIADPQIVAALVAGAGAASEDIAAHMPAAEVQFDAFTDEAIARGVFGVPFYIVGEETFWGQDRLDDLDWHLSRH
ncbi:MAG: 2-hydroxychromene-2-carboxylate isomerase [Pseudomonadota bacterium]